MKTIHLDANAPSVEELVAIARDEPVVLVSEDGTRFVLEEADTFECEVAQLAGSEKFISFLAERSKEVGVISIEQFCNELDAGPQ